LQRIREAERDALYSTLVDKAGEIALGTIQSVEYPVGDVIVNVEGAEALLPVREQVPGERYRRGGRLRAYVVDVRRGNRGPQITLSRRSPALLGRLLELEVPEIFNGTVEVKAIAREAGSRSKVAVHATRDGVDPVGSCVGVRGGRIQTIVNELGGEKIDVVQWDAEPGNFIANALSPAKVMNVLLEDDPETGKTATVIVPDRQLSLAIGKEGQNARLAAKLTGWRIDIKSATETAEETLGRFEQPALAPEDMDLLALAETILRGRVSPEFSDTERALIEGDMKRDAAADLPWPEKPADGLEPAVAGVEELPASIVDGDGDSPPQRVEDTEGGELLTAAEVETEAEVAGATAKPEVAEIAESAEPESLVDEETDTIPPFDGEPVEDSLGWVTTEPPEEYQYDWGQDAWEEGDEEPDLDWQKEEEDEKELGRPQKKKRKKRGRHKTERDGETRYDVGRWR
jgi:N utilization substance protein A